MSDLGGGDEQLLDCWIACGQFRAFDDEGRAG
jgi:hypothetical protein